MPIGIAGSSLYTRWLGYSTNNVALYKWNNKDLGQGFDMEETEAIAKESMVAYERRDPVGSRAHSLGLGMDI